VVRYLGAHPVLVDIEPETLNIDIEAMRAALSPRTRAVIPVHFAGLPCDMDPIIALAHAHGAAVIEDAAHAFPARYGGRLIGTLDSDATVFSFYANKTMTTGEGGMLVTRDPLLAERARVMRLHGIRQDAFDRYVSKVPAWFYEVVAPGFKYNLSDIAASIGLQQLRRIDDFLRRRTELARTYHELLACLPLDLPPAAPAGGTHAWHLYPVRLQAHAAIDRDELIRKLYERGIGASVHFIPLHRHPYWRDTYGLRDGQFPHADQAFRTILSLPLYTRMQKADQLRVCDALAELL
jgi:dTDP-4-amino-4,6-dideoxygalactose transaminase